MGGVNLLCRAGVLGKVGSEDVIIARLPYSETLYLWRPHIFEVIHRG